MNNFPFIAIVDDDNIYRLAMKELLKSTGLVNHVLEFESGKPMLEYLRQGKESAEMPDIILLDINMPEMDAWGFLDAYEKLQNTLSKRAKIYIVSSSSNDQDILKAKTYTCLTNYIVKPIRKSDLIKELELGR